MASLKRTQAQAQTTQRHFLVVERTTPYLLSATQKLDNYKILQIELSTVGYLNPNATSSCSSIGGCRAQTQGTVATLPSLQVYCSKQVKEVRVSTQERHTGRSRHDIL